MIWTVAWRVHDDFRAGQRDTPVAYTAWAADVAHPGSKDAVAVVARKSLN